MFDPNVTTGAGGSQTTSTGATTSTGSTGGGGGQGGNPPSCDEPVAGMVIVDAGPFMMGCNDGVDDLCNQDESPYHEVTLDCFQIDSTEVTRADYNTCIEAGVCTTPACDFDPVGLAEHPVTCVTWDDAAAYCAWAGKRLPTEAEWEKAARGTSGVRYPWGNDWFDDCDLVNANLCRLDTEPVGTHPTGASIYGAMDIAGNVREWVNDRYGSTYYTASPAENPQGPDMGALRVIRGGSWNSSVVEFRTSFRGADAPTLADNETGFRCAK